MIETLPQIIIDLLNGDARKITHETHYCNSCKNEKTIDKAVEALHARPVHVISSTKFDSLEEAEDQINEWFENGTLDAYSAVYRLDDAFFNHFYVVSSTEFDSLEEANEQMISWHNDGMLDKNARVYKTSLADTYEIPRLKLEKASLL